MEENTGNANDMESFWCYLQVLGLIYSGYQGIIKSRHSAPLAGLFMLCRI